jgi:hypothetical protein
MTASDAGLLSPEIDGLLLRMRGLVLVRRLLAERGATQDELDAHSHELERVRRRLADAISEPGTALGRRGDPLEL